MTTIQIPGQIERVSVASLVPYARNSRTHSAEQVLQLAASIREFGFTNPVLIDDRGEIIAGHGRVMAARSIGMQDVPCIRLGHLTDAQKRAYVIADNKLALNAGWDEAMLRAEIEALQADSFDVGLLGFSDDELAELFDPVAPDDGRDPDDAPAIAEDAVSRTGDVWVLGPHRVVCGDSTQIGVWDALMRGEVADCVWTDPPYNVAYESRLAGKIENDDLGDREFLEMLRGAFACLASVMKPGAAIYVAHADGEPGYAFRRAFREVGFKLSGCLIWRNNQLVLGRSDYQWIHEPILYGWKPGSRHRWFGGRKQVTVQELGETSPFVQQEDGTWAVRIGDQTLIVEGGGEGNGPVAVVDSVSRQAVAIGRASDHEAGGADRAHVVPQRAIGGLGGRRFWRKREHVDRRGPSRNECAVGRAGPEVRRRDRAALAGVHRPAGRARIGWARVR